MSRLDDPARLAAVQQIEAFGAEHQPRFDRVVRMARRVFDVPVVAINVIDDQRQMSVANVGLHSSERPVAESICAAAVVTEKPLVLTDASLDPDFADHPAVTADHPVVFYAGHPLWAGGQVVGTLCLADSEPRQMSAAEDRMLADLAAWVEHELLADQDQADAHEVQRRLLPRRDISVPGLTVAARCTPARRVPGDFYDWQELDDTVQVVLADVMGKGMTAAVLAAGIRALLRGTSPFKDLASSVTRAAHDSQDDLDDAETFVTMFACRVDPKTGAVEYLDAGHGLAVVLSPDSPVRRLRAGGLPLGALPGDRWETSSTHLEPGETLLIVSDGILDAFPDAEAALRAAADLAAFTTDPETVVRLVTDRALDAAVTDDISVVALCRESV